MQKQTSSFFKGLILIFCSLALFPTSLDLMQDHDDVESQYERECDIQYRTLTGNFSAIDTELCSELYDERSRRLALFIGCLAAFVISGLVGLVIVLPGDSTLE